jgi:hypothetical protein
MATRIKKTTKKKAGIKTESPKALTKTQYAKLKKAEETMIELSKPIDLIADELFADIKVLEFQLAKLKERLLNRAAVARKNGKRFKSFQYIEESEITDMDAVKMLFLENLWVIPTHEVFDWKAAKQFLEDNGIIVPTKTKTAYLKKVK